MSEFESPDDIVNGGEGLSAEDAGEYFKDSGMVDHLDALEGGDGDPASPASPASPAHGEVAIPNSGQSAPAIPSDLPATDAASPPYSSQDQTPPAVPLGPQGPQPLPGQPPGQPHPTQVQQQLAHAAQQANEAADWVVANRAELDSQHGKEAVTAQLVDLQQRAAGLRQQSEQVGLQWRNHASAVREQSNQLVGNECRAVQNELGLDQESFKVVLKEADGILKESGFDPRSGQILDPRHVRYLLNTARDRLDARQLRRAKEVVAVRKQEKARQPKANPKPKPRSQSLQAPEDYPGRDESEVFASAIDSMMRDHPGSGNRWP